MFADDTVIYSESTEQVDGNQRRWRHGGPGKERNEG